MRTKLIAVVALLVSSGLSGVSEAAVRTIYVPYVAARIKTGAGSFWWESSCFAANFGSESGTVRHFMSYGSGIKPADPAACKEREYELTPGELSPAFPCVMEGPDSGVGFLTWEISGPIRFTSRVYRVAERTDCSPFGPGPHYGYIEYVPQGRYAIPVYDDLFPAGTSVFSDDVDLGNPDLNPTCPRQFEKFFRRLNATLFNPGNVPASFVVRVHARRPEAASPILERQVTVPPREVLQLNGLEVPVDHVLTGGVFSALVWVEVTADQPFLSYVSTIFDGGEPGSLPFEVQGMHPAP